MNQPLCKNGCTGRKSFLGFDLDVALSCFSSCYAKIQDLESRFSGNLLRICM